MINSTGHHCSGRKVACTFTNSGQMLMAQMRGQERKFGVKILTGSIPASQGADGKVMPKIMAPWEQRFV